MRSWRDGLLVALLATACGSSEAALPAYDTGLPDYAEGLDTCEAVTWDGFADGYMRTWCTSCHSSELAGTQRGGAPPGVDFDTLAGTRALAPRIEARVLTEVPTMPPVGGSDDEERARLQAWIDCGMPE